MANTMDKREVRVKGRKYCREQLMSLGWDVTELARNNKQGVDFIVHSKDGSHSVGIKVRTLSKHAAVGIGSSLDRVAGNFWVIVTEIATTPSAFVLPSQKVKELANRDSQYWLETRDYRQEKFREAWEQIGRGDV